MRVRPRRAMPAPIAVRVARVAGPAVAAGALITTVAVTAWPSSTGALQAVPIDSLPSASPSILAPPSVSDDRTSDRRTAPTAARRAPR